MAIKHYMLTAPAFIGGALLVAGSRINSDDLGTAEKPVLDKDGKPTGKTETVEVAPPKDAIEVDEHGVPKRKEDSDLLASVVGDVAGVPIAPVQPHAPNPTHPQGAPAQPAGGVQVVDRQLPTEPAEGVESNEAAEARADQREAAQDTAQAISDKAEAPKRRGSK